MIDYFAQYNLYTIAERAMEIINDKECSRMQKIKVMILLSKAKNDKSIYEECQSILNQMLLD